MESLQSSKKVMIFFCKSPYLLNACRSFQIVAIANTLFKNIDFIFTLFCIEC